MASAARTKNCLRLGPEQIGSKKIDMGTDLFDKTSLGFQDTDEGAYLLQHTQRQLQETYPSVYDGTMKELLTFPPQYDYGVETKRGDKARAMQYGDEVLIKKRIQQLDQKAKLKTEDMREKKFLEKLVEEKLPLSCEAKVVLRLRKFFENEPGICLHGYKPEEYLQRYREVAKDMRESFAPTRLSTLEGNILSMLNIPVSDVEQWVESEIANIEAEKLKIQPQTSTLFSGIIIQAALKLDVNCPKERKNQFMELKRTFAMFQTKWNAANKRMEGVLDQQGNKVECVYTKTELRSKLYRSEYERLTSFNDEFDCIMFLANHRLILGTEIKQSMPTSTPKANDNQAREASKQAGKRQDYIEKTFGDLLENGWRYVKIVALYDNKGSLVQNKCTDCDPFILTDGTYAEEEKQMQNLWTELTSKTGRTGTQNHTGFQDFKHVFSRVVGLSGLFMTIQKVDSYHHIMGTDATGISAGWTRSSALKFGNENDLKRYGDMIGRPHDIYQLIFFSQDQIGLLAMKHKCVVFLDDYGSGKISIHIKL